MYMVYVEYLKNIHVYIHVSLKLLLMISTIKPILKDIFLPNSVLYTEIDTQTKVYTADIFSVIILHVHVHVPLIEYLQGMSIR